ncbi:hypothetical protein AB0E69_22855 [Kribbella sp. NPDC026611]|uniref:hypothetical protein n=1 Tax=Kribbella sp. NPDC026611 TaxID=3154911 RepID=UPI00340AA165
MIAKLVAAALLLTGLTVPAHATTLACSAEILPPAEGSPASGSSWVKHGDDTGQYLLGEGTHPSPSGGYASRPVLWTDGKPQWLDPEPDFWSEATDVNNSGTVIGQTGSADGGRHAWTWENGSYKAVPVPDGLEDPTLSAINNRGDIVGYAWDPTAEIFVSMVWPAGKSPIQLAAKGDALAGDINEKGVVVGTVRSTTGTTGTTGTAASVWLDWRSQASPLPSKLGTDSHATEIRGNWIGGKEQLADGTWSGLVWDLSTKTVESRPAVVSSVNTSGDAALEATIDSGSVIVKADGTRVDLPAWSNIYHLFDRGQPVSAGGYDGDAKAMIWTGCFPPDHS